MPGNSFLQVFAKSPIKPLEEHSNKVQQCCESLVPFFEAVFQEDWKEAESCYQHISDLEKQADDIKRDIRLNLPNGIFMPVARTDVLELLSQQDRIANKAEDIAGRVAGRELNIPEPIRQPFTQYLDRCIDATRMANKVINELDELLATGFRGREVELVERMIDTLDDIENDTDTMQVALRRALQSIEDQHNPIDMMFLYRIIEWMGDLADLAERVGSRLEIMLSS